MEMELNDDHLMSLLKQIGQKLSEADGLQLLENVCCVGSFATKLIAATIIGVADTREDALNGVRGAFADCEGMINRAYDVIDLLKASQKGSAH